MAFELLPLIFTLLRWTEDIEPFKRPGNRCLPRSNAFQMVVHVMHFQRQVKGHWSQTEQSCRSWNCIRSSRIVPRNAVVVILPGGDLNGGSRALEQPGKVGAPGSGMTLTSRQK
jgi:hypothetical protein